MKKLRIAVVGLGDIGRYVAGFLRFDPAFVPQLVVDTNKERAREGARRFRFQHWSTRFEAALEDDEIDAVYLAVPHALHHAMIIRAIEAGKPVLCEKPITISVADARDVAARSRSLGIPVAVNYQYRFDPAAARMIHLARSGELGELGLIRCTLAWNRDESYFRASPWHASLESSGGGTLLTQASHAIDLGLLAATSPSIAAWGWMWNAKYRDVEVEDSAIGVLELANGARLEVTSTMYAQKEHPLGVELFGTRGSLRYRGSGARRLEVRLPELAPRGRGSRPVLPAGVHPLHRSMRAFRAWVLTGEPSMHEAQSAVPVLEAVQACYTSARSGSVRVPIEPQENGR